MGEDLEAVKDDSADMIIAGQAAHWFDLPQFLAECRRALVPGGLVALFGYATPVIATSREAVANDDRTLLVNPSNNALNARLIEFYRALDWPADRAHVETRYEELLLDSNSLQGV